MSSITLDKSVKFDLEQKKLDLKKQLNEDISWNEFFEKVKITLPEGDENSTS
jgi:hypothetical protein